MTKKTFRGLLLDGGQDKIHLAGDKPEDGYRVTKFEIISSTPGLTSVEQITKIYKTKQSAINATIDFTDEDLLGAAYWSVSDTSQRGIGTIIFDGEVVNQDIYVTYKANAGSEANSYYIELEQVKMSGPEQAAVNFRAALAHGG